VHNVCLKDCSGFSFSNKKLVSVKFWWVSHKEELCDLCRLNNFLMVEKSKKKIAFIRFQLRDRGNEIVLVKGQRKRNPHDSVGKATFLECVTEMTRQF
jgi:hypothetical protein